jgi:hypothetical protein
MTFSESEMILNPSHKIYKKNINQRVLLLIIAIIIYTVFYSLYKQDISLTNSYRGFFFHQLSFEEFFVSIFFYFLPLFFLPISLKRPSDVCLWSLYIFSYAPATMMCFYITTKGISSTSFFLFLMLCALITLKYFRYHSYKAYSKKITRLKYIDKILFFIFFLLITVIALNLIDFRFNLDLISIYERRLFARDMNIGAQVYLISIGRSLLTILGVYIALVNKKLLYGMLVIIFSFAIFSYDGTKSTILMPLYLSLIFYIYSHSKFSSWIPMLIALVVVLSLLEFHLVKTNNLSEFLTRRIIAVPGYINTAYWDFFCENNKVLLTDSVGRYFLDQVYDRPPAFLIGLEAIGDKEMNANTGIWMGAYTHFGIVGIFIISAIAGFILGLIDNLTKKNYFMLGTLVCAYIGIIWSEQMFHTSMLSGGVFYIILFLFLVRSSKIISPEMNFGIKPNISYGQ